jgi:mannose-6-phosphate isomerase-like protein (cupin superfamily)
MASPVDVKAPWWAVIGPEEGESLWQPEPTRGHVTINLTPENTPYDGFSSGIQVLPPGCNVREHGHLQNHELIFIYEGTGRCEIEDDTYEFGPGTTIMFGRHARHLIENTGDVDIKLFWVFFPPALEDWFRAIGKPRTPGDPMPEAFPRPDDVMDIYNGMKFVPPRPDAK